MGAYSDDIFYLQSKLKSVAIKDAVVNPKISIIVSTLDSEQNIANCLLSLAKQTLKEIEIIVIDRGSTDYTLNLLSVFEQLDARFKVIKQNQIDLIKANNKGLEIAKGEYISFVNSKNYISKDFFEKIFTTAKKNNSKTAAKLTFHKTEDNKLPQLLYTKITRNNRKG